MVSNPQGGAYLSPDEHTDLLPPNQSSVRLSSTRKGMIITWIDRENKKNNVLYYEVMLDSDTEQIFPFFVEKLHSQGMEKNETNNEACEEISVPDIEKPLPPLKYSVCFCHLTVNEGQLVEVKVTGPQTVKVQFRVYQTEEDSAINECLIEYTDVNNSEATSWVDKKCKISQLKCTENTSDNLMEKYYTRTVEGWNNLHVIASNLL